MFKKTLTLMTLFGLFAIVSQYTGEADLSVRFHEVAMAADTTGITYSKSVGAVTLDSAYDVAWELIDSIVIVGRDTASGTATLLLTFSGIARLDPGDQFWIGFDNDSIDVTDSLAYAASRDIDSIQVQGLGRWARGRIDWPFNIRATTTLATGTTDTIFVVGACGGSAGIERVELSNTVYSVEIGFP